jgi:hypothetical protein
MILELFFYQQNDYIIEQLFEVLGYGR